MKYFGTDGIRQPAEKFTPDFLMAVVQGLVNYGGDNIKVLLGGDTRESTEWILADLETALETFGIEYGNVGVLPTPAINYCFPQMGFSFAIDVTASHNPYTDNGIKIFELGENGPRKLSAAGRNAIEEALANTETFTPISPSLRENLHKDAVDLYVEHLKNYVGKMNFKAIRIGMDCANGAMSVIGKKVFKDLGARVLLTNADDHYGTDINNNCGSTHLEPLQALVKEHHLDFGVAFDGDGDRCILVDREGGIVDGDQILAILTHFLGLHSMAVTVMANQGLLNWAEEQNITCETTPVGDANVLAAMQEHGLEIGGEQSGHIILPGEPTGDGMLTALMMSRAILHLGQPLSKLAKIITKLPQVTVNLPATAAKKQALEEKPESRKLLLDYAKQLQDMSGRLLVRPSGTEDLIRITLWGENAEQIELLATTLKQQLEQIL